MSEISGFESRPANIPYTSEKVFNFIKDIRNFERFIPRDIVTESSTGTDSGSFKAGMLGSVNIQVAERVPCNRVVFTGSAPGNNNFEVTADIDGNGDSGCTVKIKLTADLNPVLRMMAAEPVRRFLETLVNEMERFSDWDNIK